MDDSLKRFLEENTESFMTIERASARAFCPTGKDGGIDNSCGSKDGGGGKDEAGAGSGPAHAKDSEAYKAREAHRATRDVADYPVANPAGIDTAEQHKNEDGSWTPERQAMHEEIIADATAGVPKSEKPTLYMMGGGPAAGKSSLIKNGDVVHPENHVLANPDEFKADIPEYRDGLNAGDTKAAANAHEESSYLNKSVMSAARGNGQDVVWDGTGDNSIEKLEASVKPFKEAGYEIQADYVTVDTEVAVQRSNERGAKTGRYVPEKDIRQTHANVSKIWPEAVARGLFDRSDLYDTSAGGRPVKIASARGNKLEIHDREAYQRFLDKARDGDGDGKINEGKK